MCVLYIHCTGYVQAFERNAILENELDEKQRLGEMCQRLKDEVRGELASSIIAISFIENSNVCPFNPDLHAELSRQNRNGTPHTQAEQSSAPPPISHAPTQHPPAPTNLDTSPLIKANPSPHGTPLHTTFAGTQNFTPSTRISALNMVGDLLRKVGVSIYICIL